jgi:hypothetical protein
LKKNFWVEEIIVSLIELGGQASLSDIYMNIYEHKKIEFNNYIDWKSQIRKNIYLHSSDCDIFKGTTGDESDLFYSINGKGKGNWAIRKNTFPNF